MRHGMTFSLAAVALHSALAFNYFQIRCRRKAVSHELTDALNIVGEAVCPSWHWLPEHSLASQHEIYSPWVWWSQVLSAGRAITSEDQCTSNQPLSYHEIKEHRSVQHVPGLQAVRDLVADNAQYIHICWRRHNFIKR